MTQLLSVTCTLAGTNLTVNSTWDSSDTETIVILDSSGNSVSGTGTPGAGASSWVPSAGAMQQDRPYWAQVTVNQIPSLKVLLIWHAPTDVTSQFDGQAVTIGWKAPPGLPSIGAYQVLLYDGTTSQTATCTTNGIVMVPSLALDASKHWTVTITPYQGISVGPALTDTVVTQMVAIAAVACAATGQVAITPVSSPYTSFLVTLSQNGNPVQLPVVLPLTSGVVTLTAAPWPESPAGGYAVAIRPVLGLARGATSVPVGLIVTAPVIAMAAVSGGAAPSVQITIVPPPGLPVASGFSATVINGSGPAGQGNFNGTSGTLLLTSALDATAYTLSVAAANGSNSTGPAATVTLLTAAPFIGIVAVSNSVEGMIEVDFGALPDGLVFQADFIANGAIVDSAQSNGGGYVLVPSIKQSFFVVGRYGAPGLLGPGSNVVEPIFGPPVGPYVTYDLTGTATLNWAAPLPQSPPSYTAEVYDGGITVWYANLDGSPTSTVLGMLVTGHQMTATVYGAQKTGSGATEILLLGPRCNPIRVLTNPPTGLAVAFDGTTATLSWEAPTGGGVEGFLVTLTDSAAGVATFTATTGATSFSTPYVVKPASVVTVAVQAVGANAVGPAVTAPLFTPALFVSTDSASAPYLAPSASLAFGKQPLAIYLPALLTAPKAALPSNTSFTLATTTVAPWAYQLTVNPVDAVWKFDATPIRAALQADVTDFLSKMTAQGLTPQGDLLLRQALARILPMTFLETLFYAYNFNIADGGQGQGLVDLTPGMALRVEEQTYENLPTALQSGNAGLAGNAAFDYDITSYRAAGQWRLGIDAFLSRLAGHGTVFPGPSGGTSNPSQSGAGGAPDFYYPNFLQPFFRLIYPPQYLASFESGGGTVVSSDLRKNVTLIAASTRAALDTATATLRNPGGTYQPVNALYFRGRSMITPRIHVRANGAGLTVPLGTTVANLLERFAVLDAAGGPRVRMRRALDGVQVVGQAQASNAVRLDWTGGTVWGDGTTWLDLPLLHGDTVELVAD
ncbi:hypothetical protein [Massilia antarctica]|uniref:hypothetical protein n=1 Tax=Massilia antarctica TaxID=2765360 RepID=UPI0022707ECD|nr:hypothetical protein [Massilia sp. H27-R4]MCY0916313.1 hypothetical protein [Massilia sp. H27-R4]